jgi:hypothetical protein
MDTMDLDDLIITWFCLIDAGLHVALDGERLRASGPRPTLADTGGQ